MSLNKQLIMDYFRNIFYHYYNFSNNSNNFYGVELKTEPLKNRATLFSVEKKLKFKIPQDYKNIILKCSGINIDLTIDNYNDNKGSFVGDSFYGFNWNKTDILKEIDNLKELFDYYLEEDFISDEIGDLLDAPMLPIGSGDSGDIYAIDLSKNDLYWFQHDDSNYYYYLGPIDHVFKSRVKSWKSFNFFSFNPLLTSKHYRYYHGLSDREFLSLIKELPKKPLYNNNALIKVENLLEEKIPINIKKMILESSGILFNKEFTYTQFGYSYAGTFKGLNWNVKNDVLNEFEKLHFILENSEGPYTLEDKKYLIPIGTSWYDDLYVLDSRNYKVYLYLEDHSYKKGVNILLEEIILN